MQNFSYHLFPFPRFRPEVLKKSRKRRVEVPLEMRQATSRNPDGHPSPDFVCSFFRRRCVPQVGKLVVSGDEREDFDDEQLNEFITKT